jgi:catechol 2,3-dioxygenase-like lactoylglutathione lyase family enzyme
MAEPRDDPLPFGVGGWRDDPSSRVTRLLVASSAVKLWPGRMEHIDCHMLGAHQSGRLSGGTPHTEGRRMDLKLEVVPIPVSDVDAAKAFYTQQVGFELDHDIRPSEGMRVVQMTPPGSACSVVIGEGLPLGAPGSVKGVQLVVEDVDAVREEFAGRGVGVSDVQQLGPEGSPGSRFLFFEDPDGNTWAVQELKRS